MYENDVVWYLGFVIGVERVKRENDLGDRAGANSLRRRASAVVGGVRLERFGDIGRAFHEPHRLRRFAGLQVPPGFGTGAATGSL